ncbi:MAG: hypothetical protein CM15mP21_6410 [Hyphomicrobiales bacterium]|nr:MAG: hypothetical protein CM15mP21_6410 [Hyphomicrobiales bacterium]
MSDSKNPETIVLHAGWRSDPTTGSVAVPIHQTTSYQFNSTDHAASLFALAELGNISDTRLKTRRLMCWSNVSRRLMAVRRATGRSVRTTASPCVAEYCPRRRQYRITDRPYADDGGPAQHHERAWALRFSLLIPTIRKTSADAPFDERVTFYAETSPNP